MIYQKFESKLSFLFPKKNLSNEEKQNITGALFVFIFIFFIVLFYTLFYMWNGHISDTKAILNYLGLCNTFILLMIIKKWGNVDLALLVSATNGIIFITLSILMSGGFKSADLYWYAVVTTTTMLLIGKKSGIYMFVLSMVFIAVFYFNEKAQWVHFETFPIVETTEYKIFNFFLITGIIGGTVYLLKDSNDRLNRTILLNREHSIRENIARDFHDQIGNKLASIRQLSEMSAKSTLPNQQVEFNTTIERKSKEVYDNFKDFIWTLDQSNGNPENLYEYIKDYAEDLFNYTAIRFYIFTEPSQTPALILKAEFLKELIPALKEILTNVLKHSEADQCELIFNWNTKIRSLTVSIKDNGKGMQLIKEKNTSNGIKNITHRIQKLNGELSFEPNTPSGTKVSMSIPYPNWVVGD